MPVYVNTISGPLFHQRLIVKSFVDLSAAHVWLNNRYDNNWQLSSDLTPLKAGTYARIGGKWTNIKKISADLLPHI